MNHAAASPTARAHRGALRGVVMFWMLGAFFGMGTLMAAAIFLLAGWQAYRERYVYVETTGTTQATRPRDELVSPKPTKRRRKPDIEPPPYFVYHPEVQIRYTAGPRVMEPWIDASASGNKQDRALMAARQ